VTETKLHKLLSPESVAIIGASERYENPGSVVILNMQRRGFAGKIYPINPKYDSIHGINTYKSINDLPEAPDCVLICVNAGLVPMM
jgi:acyl-CoA synthetase (NDP forming)